MTQRERRLISSAQTIPGWVRDEMRARLTCGGKAAAIDTIRTVYRELIGPELPGTDWERMARRVLSAA